ncbi:MAG TPA: phosphatase PAP2 family protein [Burkholderiaceae bacterium]|nr:phosphatase PAP2 family protein [Burkholderiaceae bacterium]
MSRLLLGVALWSTSLGACAAGGPLGIDHRVNMEESGVWSREIQKAIFYGSMATSVSGALIEGTETRLGLTFWRAAESGGIAAIEAGVMKKVFTRPRPSQINDPDLWFQGNNYQSFPSGETALATGVVTPFILEYGRDQPAVWALAAIPTYVAMARVKSQAHWQTDVLTSIALGTATGYFVSQREHPLTLSFQPGGVFVGLRYRW